jgi:glucose-6-phosphate isomerase
MNDSGESLTQSRTWTELRRQADSMSGRSIADLFAEDTARGESFSINACGLLGDFSKQRIDEQSLRLLCDLAAENDLEGWKRRLFSGEEVNCTEKRPAMHWQLRQPDPAIAPEVHQQLTRMQSIVERILLGHWRGYLGDPITDVLNIGVGGSELGPLMASFALNDYYPAEGIRPRVHFVSSMDGSQLSRLLDNLVPQKTLVVVSSKSFTTVDTLYNAGTARSWLETALGDRGEALMRSHFVGISAHPDRMSDWGILPANQLRFWDWVGGRYSMWSSIGLPIALTIGMPGFKALLRGAHAMDLHFRDSEPRDNLAVMLALIDIWNINFLDIRTHAVLPYDGRLKYWPAYLEQLEMESNGKSVGRTGSSLDYSTCPVIWGDVGPNAQHAFYQLLHQGTQTVACDFIMTAKGAGQAYSSGEAAELAGKQHDLANANCLAQSRLLAFGDAALSSISELPHYKRYRGNQPSTTLVLDQLSPESLGTMIALYEHKVFVQAVIWGINPFDQWGVEMGKVLANEFLSAFVQGDLDASVDSSSRVLLRHLRHLKAD